MPMYSLPSLRQPESISPQFYFSSQSFIAKAEHDIQRLLNTYQDSVTKTHNKKYSSNGPFLKFKSIYSRLGWIYIHLSVVDPALRKHWFNTLIRLLLKHLQPNSHPIIQVATIFTLWAFWGTQPTHSVLGPKLFIIIDPITKSYLDHFPQNIAEHLNQYFNQDSSDQSFQQQPQLQQSQQQQHTAKSSEQQAFKHRAHLDPNIFGPPPPTIKPSDSVYQVINNLNQHHAFIIQPTQTALTYPPLPTNRLSPFDTSSSLDLHPIDTQQQTSSSSPPSTKTFSTSPALLKSIQSTKLELDTSFSNLPLSLCDPTQLNRLRNAYLSTKCFLTGLPHPTTSSTSPSSTPSSSPRVVTIPVLGQPDPLTHELVSEAIGMTRKVIQKTGPGLDHLLFPTATANQPHSSSGPHSTTSNINHSLDQSASQPSSLDAFFLVDKARAIPDLQSLLASSPSSASHS